MILVVNAGSSSLKLRVLDDDDQLAAAVDLPMPNSGGMREALAAFLAGAPDLTAAGHRVVHGGPGHVGPARLDGALDDELERLCDLAPLHNPPALAGIRALEELWPALPQAACFDTAFHASLPPAAYTFAIPRAWASQWGLRRYGFHGLSHAWASRRAAALLDRPVSSLRLVTAHLGSGASLAAVAAGRSVDTTMGFTPLDGLVMSTRPGTVDPGVVLWVQQRGGLTADETEHALEHDSGLLGISGVSGDLRHVLDAIDAGDGAARLAYDVYLHRLRAGIAAMAAAMGGIEGLVFTGGAGEASARLRHDACDGLGFLGISLDDDLNWAAAGDAVVSAPESPVATAVVETREDLEIARQVRALLS
jgi:acetate kinase